jgi:hypothetical protein
MKSKTEEMKEEKRGEKEDCLLLRVSKIVLY